jgi:predicted SAM-dependent methyltransferase
MKILLHVGCGFNTKKNTTPEFNTHNWKEVRLDINSAVSPDIIGTMTNMSGVNSASVNAIFSSHNIEHLYPHEVPVALSEFLRVLTDDGIAVITCPDLISVCSLVAADKLTDVAYVSPSGPISPIDILYGHRQAIAQNNSYMAHRCGFTRKVLDETLRSSGFKSVATLVRPQYFDLWALCSKSLKDQTEMKNLVNMHFPK